MGVFDALCNASLHLHIDKLQGAADECCIDKVQYKLLTKSSERNERKVRFVRHKNFVAIRLNDTIKQDPWKDISLYYWSEN